MVGRYPAIRLMPREPIPVRLTTFNPKRCLPGCYGVLVAVSSGYPPDRGRLLTRYAPLRRSPSICIATYHAAPRLACVKPAASVHPEPGSNSSLYIKISQLNPLTLPYKSYKGINATLIVWYLVVLCTSLVLSLSSILSMILNDRFFPKRAAKIRTFCFPPNFFLVFFNYFSTFASDWMSFDSIICVRTCGSRG